MIDAWQSSKYLSGIAEFVKLEKFLYHVSYITATTRKKSPIAVKEHILLS